jgi:hypothetical protein
LAPCTLSHPRAKHHHLLVSSSSARLKSYHQQQCSDDRATLTQFRININLA